jgi:hypothetical protein
MPEEPLISFYAIDRLDGPDWVVLEDGTGRTFQVPRAWLPADAREGDVIRVQGDDTSPSAIGLSATIDADATAHRAGEASDRRRRLKRGPEGDISL